MSKSSLDINPGFILSIFAVILYINTLFHEFALDDTIVIASNEFTQKGIEGIKDIFSNDSFTGFFGREKKLVTGGRYRPLSIAMFALEVELFGTNPLPFHVINILLYALSVFIMYYLLHILFPPNNRENKYLSIAFMATLIWMVHPVHTEVVANIKGRDEILALLFSLLNFMILLKYTKKPNISFLVLSFFLFLFALLSKEIASVFILIIPIAAFFFTAEKPKSILIKFIPLILAFLVFWFIRGRVLDTVYTEPPRELMNNPFLQMVGTEKVATIIYTLGKYLLLLVFPHPLTYDYYPYHIQIHTIKEPVIAIIIAVYLCLFIASLMFYKKNRIYFFSLLIYGIALLPVSNLIFPVGAFMNERFLYIPSIGFSLVLAAIFQSLLKKERLGRMAKWSLVIIILLFSFKTFSRNKVWKNDRTLFLTDAEVSKNSAKSNCTAGGTLIEMAKESTDENVKTSYLHRSKEHLKKSLQIHPFYIDAMRLLGNAYFYENKPDSSLYWYYKILDIDPENKTTTENVFIVINKIENPGLRIRYLKQLLNYQPNNDKINYRIGNLYGKHLHQIDSAILYLRKAAKINPMNHNIAKDLGVAYGIRGDYEKSEKWLREVIKLKPEDANNYINLGLTLANRGKKSEAERLFYMADSITKNQQKNE